MDLYSLDPADMNWKDLSDIGTGEKPSPRDSIGIASVNRKIYIFGGYFRKGVLNLKCLLILFPLISMVCWSHSSVDLWYNDLFEFNPASMTWKNLGKMTVGTPPAPSKDNQAFTSLGGKLYRFGGLGFHGYRPDISMQCIMDCCWLAAVFTHTWAATHSKYYLVRINDMWIAVVLLLWKA